MCLLRPLQLRLHRRLLRRSPRQRLLFLQLLRRRRQLRGLSPAHPWHLQYHLLRWQLRRPLWLRWRPLFLRLSRPRHRSPVLEPTA